MTSQFSDIINQDGPLYQRLAEKIESDIDRGVLVEGDKLPPQRELANNTGTTIGTVGRAYTLLEKKGLIRQKVGSGTYVLQQKNVARADVFDFLREARNDHPTKKKEKILFNKTDAPDIGQSTIIKQILTEVIHTKNSHLSACNSNDFPVFWREAGSQWLSRNSFHASPDTIIPASNIHTGLMATIAGLTNPGDTIVFEHLTCSKAAQSAAMIGRRIVSVSCDEEGMDPKDFERVCIRERPKAVFLMPSVQNPTAVTLSTTRRMKIAQIACDHDTVIIEDDTYNHGLEDSYPLMAELAPERTVLAGGLSKSISSELTGGWISCPAPWYRRIRIAYNLMAGQSAGLPLEVASRLVLSGEAIKIREECTTEINHRLHITCNILAGFSFNTCLNIPFIWLSLPEPWLSGIFAHAAEENGLLLDSAEKFMAKRSEKTFHAIRFSISEPNEIQEVRRGVSIIRCLLEEGHVGYTGSD